MRGKNNNRLFSLFTYSLSTGTQLAFRFFFLVVWDFCLHLCSHMYTNSLQFIHHYTYCTALHSVSVFEGQAVKIWLSKLWLFILWETKFSLTRISQIFLSHPPYQHLSVMGPISLFTHWHWIEHGVSDLMIFYIYTHFSNAIHICNIMV